MNGVESYLKKIVENWDCFPFKLDYIIYSFFANNNQIYDIQFRKIDGFYVVVYVNNLNEKNQAFEVDTFKISENELLNYLNIGKSVYHDFINFSYETKIFTKTHRFRVQKSLIMNEELIQLRLLSQSSQANNFNSFNNKIKKYNLFFELTENLSVNNNSSDNFQKL